MPLPLQRSKQRGPAGRLRRSRHYDMLRQCLTNPSVAVLQGSGLGMVVALQYFEAADWQKGLLAAAPTAGMLLGPAVVLIIARLGVRVAKAIASMSALGALGMLAAALAPSLPLFMAGLMLTGISLASCVPLVTAIWRQNAPAHLRGRLFSGNLMLGTSASLLAGMTIAAYIGDEPGQFRPVLIVVASLLAGGAWAASRIPSRPLEPTTARNPIGALTLLWQHPLFGYMSFAWYLIGIANLALIPLRTEFAGSAERGLGLSAGMVLTITLVIPEASRLLSTIIWGRLFDRMNFVTLRIAINVFFFFSIVLFFQPSIALLIMGSICMGIATGGGGVAWSMWVTKFSPPERTADYMAVHTFLTGTRGVLGPQLAFIALATWSMSTVAWTGAIVLTVGTLLFVPVIGHGNRTPSGARA